MVNTGDSIEEISIGIDIGGTKINIGAINYRGKIIDSISFSSNSRKSPKFIINNINEKLNIFLKKEKIQENIVKNIGIGIPGTVDSRNGIVIYAPNLNWRNIDLFKYFYLEYPYNIYLSQDTKAAALAEYIFGAGRGCKNLVCLTIGTGIGCGIIINGKVYVGSYGTAGELGHTIAKFNGRKCNCGKRGCLEAYASGSFITNMGRKLINSNKIKSGEDVFNIAMMGNEKALKIINKANHYLGIALVNILNILGPEKIIISGGLSKQKELFIDELSNFIKNMGYPVIANKVELVVAELGEYAPMVGAALLYQDSSFKYVRRN